MWENVGDFVFHNDHVVTRTFDQLAHPEVLGFRVSTWSTQL